MKRSKTTIIAGIIVGLFVLTALFAPWIAGEENALYSIGPETPNIIDAQILSPPGVHWMGTDRVGRDVLALIVHGIRNSLLFSLAVVLFSVVTGVLLGGLMGFLGGRFDMAASRVMEVIANFPIFFLQLTLLAFLGQNYAILFFVMVFAGWIPYCRFTRAEVYRLRGLDFVLAARALGMSRWRIFLRHLIPNSWVPSAIYIPFDLSSTVVALGALSFLGFGEPINQPSLGELMNQAKNHFEEAWWLAVFPGLTLFALTLSLTLFGSGVRDWLDPKEQ